MRLLRDYLKRELPAIHKNNIRMVFIGRQAQLPEGVRKDISEAMRFTEGNTGMKLVVALNYGGRAELTDAFNALLAIKKRAPTATPRFARTKTTSRSISTPQDCPIPTC